MASPTIEAVATSSTDSSSLTQTVTMPAGVVSGDLLLSLIMCDGAQGLIQPTNWTLLKLLNGHGDAAQLAAAWKQSDGAEGADEDWTVDGVTNEKSAHITYRISGHIDPAAQAPEVSTGTAANTANPDPDSVSVTGGSKTVLYIAVAGNDQQGKLTIGWPAGYSGDRQKASGGSGGCNIGSAELQETSASNDPGTFTVDSAAQSAAFTIVVHPAAAGSETGPGPEALEWMPETNQPPMTHLALGSLFGGFIPTYTIESSTGPGVEALEWLVPVSQPYPYRIDARADLHVPAFYFQGDESDFEAVGVGDWELIPAWKKHRRIAARYP